MLPPLALWCESAGKWLPSRVLASAWRGMHRRALSSACRLQFRAFVYWACLLGHFTAATAQCSAVQACFMAKWHNGHSLAGLEGCAITGTRMRLPGRPQLRGSLACKCRPPSRLLGLPKVPSRQARPSPLKLCAAAVTLQHQQGPWPHRICYACGSSSSHFLSQKIWGLIQTAEGGPHTD